MKWPHFCSLKLPYIFSPGRKKIDIFFLPSRLKKKKKVIEDSTFFLTSGKHCDSLPKDFLDLKYQLKHLCMKN